MADVVQYKLERMLPELDDLERRGLFSKFEIGEIVKQRRRFEYRLKRHSPLKSDFIAYIDYEKQLDALRLLRKKALMKEDGYAKSKKSVSDFSGVARIVEIYRLATNRFKGDIELWFQYLEFCRERRNGRMKKALVDAIRMHPTVPGLWIYAASWEFDQNLNVAAARALMQRGFRACPSSEDLWIEYLRMELTYLNKLKARKVALGEDVGTLTNDQKNPKEKQWRDENKELFMSLDDEIKDDKASNPQDAEQKDKVDLFKENGLSIFQTVYNSAIEAIPSSFSLRTRFLEILDATNLAQSEDMQKQILDDLKKDFCKEPKYWDWLARLVMFGLKNVENASEGMITDRLSEAIQVYEEGLKVVPSATMFELYVKFLTDAIPCGNGDGKSSDNSSNHVVDPMAQLLMVYEKAESMGCITEALACQHVSFLLQLGKQVEAKTLVEKFCTGKFSEAVHLWALRLSIEMTCIENGFSSNKAALLSLFELLRNVLMKVSISKAENLWLMALKVCSSHKQIFDKLIDTAVVLLAKDGGSDGGFSLSSAIVNYVLQKDGLRSAREMYRRFIALPHPGLSIYKNCIELELSIVSTGDEGSLANARVLYDAMLTTYDQDANLWRDYYSMEVKFGTLEKAAAVEWRARKTLNKGFLLLSTV
nr:U3 small nucleolar RNA-associated protein 6 homolog [Ipomoea batatas]